MQAARVPIASDTHCGHLAPSGPAAQPEDVQSITSVALTSQELTQKDELSNQALTH